MPVRGDGGAIAPRAAPLTVAGRDGRFGRNWDLSATRTARYVPADPGSGGPLLPTRRIGILGYDDVQALDVIGPSDAFTAVPPDPATGRPPYDVVILGLTGQTFRTESGIVMRAHAALPAPRLRLDTLIIPGGRAMRAAGPQAKAAAWIRARAPRIRRIASVCTGAYALAASGLVDGCHVATHWKFASDLADRFPKVHVDPEPLFIKGERFSTSAGITAGIDLALSLIEDDCGPAAALAVARELVVFLKRDGGQQQFSEPLQFQAEAADRFADLVAWINGHLDADLSVELLAGRVFMSPRHFSRTFRERFGRSPAEFVERVRLDEAARRLSRSRAAIDRVARSVGFATADGFRRAFERRFGVPPSRYRSRFAT